MKIFFVRFSFAAFAILGAQTGAADELCQTGFAAFEKTVYPKVRRDCAKCHSGAKPNAPIFAGDDAKKSYDLLLNYMNFFKVEDSMLVIRAGNGHCGEESCEVESGIEMAELGHQWWQAGENRCERNGRYFSAEVSVPDRLPTVSEGYITLSFALDTIQPSLRDSVFQIDIQEYMATTDSARGAYRFKSPRVVSQNGEAISVKDIKILLNGRYDQVYNAFTTVDKVATLFSNQGTKATLALSGQQMVIVRDGLPNPKLTVSFVKIEPTTNAQSCFNLAGFKQSAAPEINKQNCKACHTSSNKNFNESILNLSLSDEHQCALFTDIMNRQFLMSSPAIAIPTRGFGNHPQLDENQRSLYVKALKKWFAID